MRLPWPFGRVQRSPAGDAPAGDARAGSAVQRASGRAWRDLPPLAETVGPPPLVAPNRPFAAALAGGEPPPPILAPLVHGRSLEAPAGLAVGVARPVPADHGPALPPPVQRSPLGSRADADGGADLEEQSALDPFAGGAAPGAPVAEASPGPMATSSAIQRRPISATAAPARALLTRAPASASDARPVGLVGTPRSGSRPAAVVHEPSPQVAVQRAATAPSSPPPSSGARPDGSRLSIGQARRLGLGAPIVGATAPGTPVGRPIQRAPLDPGTQRSPGTSREAEPSDADEPAPLGGPVDMALAAHRRPAPSDLGGEAGPSAAPTYGPLSTAPMPGHAAVSKASAPHTPRRAPDASPIVSRRPLRTAVQRAAAALVTPTADTVQGDAARPSVTTAGPVKIHRGAAAGDLAAALDAKSFTHGGEIYMPDSHGPLSSGKGRALLAHEMTHVNQQRRLGSSLPQEHTLAGQVLEADAVAAERSANLPLATGAGNGQRPGESIGAAGSTPQPSSVGHPAVAGTPGPQRAPAAGAPAGATGGFRSAPDRTHEHSERELEILAHQLYHRIGRHLRRELLVDRERLGVALDRS